MGFSLKKTALAFGILLSGLGVSNKLQAQNLNDENGGAKKPLWSIGTGVNKTPGIGAKFDVHAMTPLYGNHTMIRVGYCLAGATYGGSGTVTGPGYESYTAWESQFSKAYLDFLAGEKVELGKGNHSSYVLAAARVSANNFPGNYDNILNYSDFTAGGTVMAYVALPFGNHSHSVGLEMGGDINAITIKNQALFNDYRTNCSATRPNHWISEKERNPFVNFHIAATLRF